MKKLLFLFLSFLVVTLVTVSCSKDRADYRPRTVQAGAQSASTYDYVGVQHNQGLDYYLQQADFKDARRQVEPVTIKFGESLGYARTDIEATLHDPKVAGIVNSAAPIDALRAYFKASGLTQEARYFDQMQAALYQSSTATDAVARLNVIEQAVAADRSISTTSQTSLLQGLAVGKHSAEYWYDQSQQGKNSPWIGKTTVANGSAPAGKIRWWIVALHDLVGGIIGGVWGGVVASINNIISQLE